MIFLNILKRSQCLKVYNKVDWYKFDQNDQKFKQIEMSTMIKSNNKDDWYKYDHNDQNFQND